MELSKRLQSVADFVTENNIVADIGTDHGYVPIYLVESGKCPSAIASDVRSGPLNRAKKHIEKHELTDYIETRISDGLAQYQPGEADTLILAGMGGSLMITIMKQGKAVLDSMKEAVLEPQSEVRKVRQWLEDQKYEIALEDMVCEDEKYYPVMRVLLPGDKMSRHRNQWKKETASKVDKACHELELRYGKYLLESKNPVLEAYLKREYEQKQAVFHELSQSKGWKVMKRKAEVLQDMQSILQALGRYQNEV